MKRLFAALILLTAVFSAAAVYSQDYYPDSDGAYSIEYFGEASNQYILLVLSGKYTEDNYLDAVYSYNDKDVLYYGFEESDEDGKVSFDKVVPTSYNDATVILGGIGLEKPLLLGYILADGANDSEYLKISADTYSVSVGGSLGEDISIPLDVFVYDSFGFKSLVQPEIKIELYSDNPAEVFLGPDKKSLEISAYAKEQTVRLSASGADFSDEVLFDVKRIASRPVRMEVFTDEQMTAGVGEKVYVYGVDGVYPETNLYCKVYDNFNAVVDKTPVYTVNGAVFSGVFKPESAGIYNVTVSIAESPEVSVTFEVSVSERPDYDETALEMYNGIVEGKTLLNQIGASVFLSVENGYDVYPNAKWVSLSAVETLENAIASANKALDDYTEGSITLSSLNKSYQNLKSAISKYKSQIKPGVRVDAESIFLSQTYVTLAAGRTAALSAKLSPSRNTDKVFWSSSDESVVTVDENGKIKFVGSGNAVITCQTRTGLRAYCNVFAYVPATKLLTDTPRLTLLVGESDYRLGCTVLPEDNSDIITWSSSNEKVATVDADGYIHAVSSGTAVIKASSIGGTASSCKVTVGLSADSVSFTSDLITAPVGKTVTLKAAAFRDDGQECIDSSVKYSIVEGSEYVKLDDNGKLTGIAPGIVKIRAEANTSFNAAFSEATVNVCIPATSVTLNFKSQSMVVGGETLKLQAEISPDYSTDKIFWSSSNENVATVDEYGNVTAVGSGSAKITAKAGGGKSAYCTVKVGLAADKVEFGNLKVSSVAVGKTLTVKATASREDKRKPISTAVNYEIVEGGEFAEIDNKGKIKALAIGRVVVRATAQASINGAYDEIEIDVVIPITAVKLSSTKQSMAVGGNDLELAQYLTVLPAENTDKIFWSSSNESVATVDEYGNVTAVGSGSAKITAKAGSGKSAYCTVSVGLAADKVEFGKLTVSSVAVGKTLTVKATASREDKSKPISTAVNYEIVEGGELAEIDNNGKIKALAIGHIVVRATAQASINGAYDEIELDIVPEMYKAVLSQKSFEIPEGETLYIRDYITVLTRDGEVIDSDSYCTFAFSVSSSAKASVDADGYITGISKGKITLRITVKCASVTKSLSATVNVIDSEVELFDSELEQPEEVESPEEIESLEEIEQPEQPEQSDEPEQTQNVY